MRPAWVFFLSVYAPLAFAFPTYPLVTLNGAEISQSLFTSLEELSRIVDISYCVGTSGIHHPFRCLSRCADFESGFELVTTWNTGPLLSDSSGYIALSHAPFEKRVIVAFRGTYSIANTIADLSTNPAEYAPFPADGGGGNVCTSSDEELDSTEEKQNPNEREPLLPQLLHQTKRSLTVECPNCTVHTGFMTSWLNTRCIIIPHVEKALANFPDYKLVLVGHSLGGAVAALAALEFQAKGWDPHVTTFGEPRVGNLALNQFIDERSNLPVNSSAAGLDLDDMKYRRVTHVDDPVPLLPLEEWGYRMHAGEIFISKPTLPPSRADVRHCVGDEDPNCIQDSTSTDKNPRIPADLNEEIDVESDDGALVDVSQSGGNIETFKTMWDVGRRYKLWELFFAHRDYFWRIGLCVPGGDPSDWSRGRYNLTEGQGEINDES